MGEDWSTVFIDLYNEGYKLKDGGVTKLKILIFSQEKEEEWNRVRKVQKDVDIKSNVSWEVVPIELKCGVIANKKSLLKKIEDVCPSHLLLNFSHEFTYGDDFQNEEGYLLHKQTGLYGLKTTGDFTEILTKGKYRLIDSSACVIKGTGTACPDTKKRRESAGSPDMKDYKFILLKTINVFRPSEGIYLVSNTAVSRGKWSEKVEKLLGNEIPENEDYTILLFCGTHGRASGKSGYSVRGPRPPGLLDKNVYDEECRNVDEFKEMCTRKHQEKYSKLKIVPYNVADLHHSQDELHKVIRSESPNMIVLDWCFSFNGDMCLALRSDAVFSQMLLEANMREIGIASHKATLSEEQKDALKLALDDKVRAIALVGPLGSGKTIVGSEIIKIWMAIWMCRHTDLQMPLDVYIIGDGRNTGESYGVDEEKGFAKKLVEDLREKYFRNMTDCNGSEIRFWDLTSQEIDKELKAWAGLINFGFNNRNCGDDEDKVKDRQTLLRSWIQKITASGKRKALVFFDEVTIEAFITQEERRRYTRNIMECDNLKANQNHVHLDFSDLTDNENVRFVISFTPTYSTKKGCINDAEGAFNNYTFQLKLPETPEAGRLLNLTNPYRNTWGIQCFVKYHRE